MRLASFYFSAAASAVVLSGCSWLNGPGHKQDARPHGQAYATSAQLAAQRCQIFSPQQPIPRGCRPEQVTLATGPAGGFPQQPQFGQPQYAQPEYTSGGYGSAVGQNANARVAQTGPKLKKPRLRGSLSLGIEKSNAGQLLDYAKIEGSNTNVVASYNPQAFLQGPVLTPNEFGGVTETTFTANEQFASDYRAPFLYESASSPSISFDDVWSTPASLRGGLEYIVDKKTTVFANGGYTHAEGNAGDVASITATVYREDIQRDDTGAVVGAGAAYFQNVEIANFSYDFSDLKRYDLEIGARRYFSPIVKSEGYRTVTPFVGASVGASHLNAVSMTTGQRQASYNTVFESESNPPVAQFDQLAPGAPGASPLVGTTTQLYDSAWVPQGQLNVGAEWQVTPGMALALESGVRIEGARDYSDYTDVNTGLVVSGRKGDTNISIPLTLRGSVNF